MFDAIYSDKKHEQYDDQVSEPVFDPTPEPRRWSRRLIVLGCAFGVLLLLIGAVIWAALNVGNWLVVQDPLEPAQAIVVLSGNLPDRAIEAARIYQQNVAAQIWISQGLSPTDQLEQMHINYLGEDFYNEKVLLALGVPADAIRILDKPAANTVEEVDEIAGDLRDLNAHTVIVVTSKAHTRRVRYIWKHLIGSDPKLIVRYSTDDAYDGAHWWRKTQDALDVSREVLGLANARAGFPLRPVSHQ
jgi:uncharacterized SAM-binding protein YcdF (DUF218 family)